MTAVCLLVCCRYECICIPGVTGKDCETDINECDSSPCQRGGTCRDKIDGYSCDCVQGVEGENCEYDINECDRYALIKIN